MTQVPQAEPDEISSNDFGGNENWQIPAIGTPEHTAFVGAIKQNFPEIYSAPIDAGKGESLRKPPAFVAPDRSNSRRKIR